MSMREIRTTSDEEMMRSITDQPEGQEFSGEEEAEFRQSLIDEFSAYCDQQKAEVTDQRIKETWEIFKTHIKEGDPYPIIGYLHARARIKFMLLKKEIGRVSEITEDDSPGHIRNIQEAVARAVKEFDDLLTKQERLFEMPQAVRVPMEVEDVLSDQNQEEISEALKLGEEDEHMLSKISGSMDILKMASEHRRSQREFWSDQFCQTNIDHAKKMEDDQEAAEWTVCQEAVRLGDPLPIYRKTSQSIDEKLERIVEETAELGSLGKENSQANVEDRKRRLEALLDDVRKERENHGYLINIRE